MSLKGGSVSSFFTNFFEENVILKQKPLFLSYFFAFYGKIHIFERKFHFFVFFYKKSCILVGRWEGGRQGVLKWLCKSPLCPIREECGSLVHFSFLQESVLLQVLW